jgi:hypothetical protein
MFHRCKTKEEVLKLWKRLLFRLHPDQGGTSELCILLEEAKEEALSALLSGRKHKAPEGRPKAKKREESQEAAELFKAFIPIADFMNKKELEVFESMWNYFKSMGKLTEPQFVYLSNIFARTQKRAGAANAP